jgi:2-hydroxychromene-2-carboxylate isomerase
MSRAVVWYFDVISPYAYLHLKQFSRLPADLQIDYRPVLFAGLLKHWGTKGPAELPAKRLHTYRQSVWLARELGVPFRMPPRHPFNPLKVLRLLIALGSTRAALETAFDFIWGEGRDPDAEWPALCAALGVTADTPLINEPLVKETLTRNTAEAVAAGVWGVPTFAVNGELFWGADSVNFMNAFLADPTLLASPDMQRAATAEIGAERRIPVPTP